MPFGNVLPKHRVHKYVSRLLLSKPYTEVHEALDLPYKIFRRKHRKWFHTPLDAYIMGTISSLDPGGGTAALLHIWLDKKCSEDKEFKRRIEIMERQDAYWRRQRRFRQRQMKQLSKLIEKKPK